MKKGIIFDVDGTLWDACKAIADSWNAYVMEHEPQIGPVVTEEGIRNACGLTMDLFGDRFFPMLPQEQRMQLTQGCCSYETEYLMTHCGKLYPDERPVMERLKQMGYHLYIVSNCQKGYIQAFLKGSGLGDLIEDTEDYGNTGKGKADNIRLLYERNHLDKAVYVGDTIMDYQSTKQAGLPFIYAAYGFGEVKDNVPRIETFSQLPETVRCMET